jgi:hypothetical protein
MNTHRSGITTTNANVLLAAMLIAASPAPARAQEPKAPPAAAIHSIKPLWDFAVRLEGLYAKPITFEEPLLTWRGDQEEVQRAPGLLGPKYRDFVPPAGLTPREAPTLTLAMLRTAIEAYHGQTDGPRYTVTESKMGFHIIPIEAADADGKPGPPVNLLDAIVTVPFARRTPTEHFQALCNAISEKSGVGIICGTSMLEALYLPNGRYFQRTDMVPDVLTPTGRIPLTPEQANRREQIHEQLSIGWGATGVPARDAIITLLEPSATTLTWYFLCQGGSGPNGRTCVLNVTTINIPKALPNGGVSWYPLLQWDRCTVNCPKLVEPPLPPNKK